MRIWLAWALLLGAECAMAASGTPLIIAHRGASADRPEHTLMAYALAIEQGADFIEPDLVPTRDGYLVARHENEISGTTDVADHAEFSGRRVTKMIEGKSVTGWFTEDFTLEELKKLKVRERLPLLRPANMRFNDMESIPTFDEILAMVKLEEARTGRRIGVYPETKHPSYFRSIGLPVEDRLLETLSKHGYEDVDSPIFIQSFEVHNLRDLRQRTRLRLIQLAASEGGPVDQPGQTYAAMLTPDGLRQIATYADGIGVEKTLVIPRASDGTLSEATSLVTDAHLAGLKVHVWTFRPENYFLPTPMRDGNDPVRRGKAAAEIRRFLEAGIDGLFSDSTEAAVRAREAPDR